MDEIKSEMEKLGLTDRDMLVKDLLKMLEQGSLNDVKIKLSDGEIVANKDILMARSDYFATMFSNNNFIEGESYVHFDYTSETVVFGDKSMLGLYGFDQNPITINKWNGIDDWFV